MKTRSLRVLAVIVFVVGAWLPAFAADRRDAGKSQRRAASTAAKVDLNTADLAALEALPGVGPQTAKAIVAARPFNAVDELENVQGIGPGKMKRLHDVVTVSRPGPATTKTDKSDRGKKTRTGKKVDLNTADLAQLEALPGVGPQVAREIVAARPFSSVDDLERVSGIGPARMADLRDEVTVSRPRSTTKKADRDDDGDRGRDRRSSSVEPASPYETTPPATRPRTTRREGDERNISPTGRVNLNTATREELEALPEIGPVKAQAIIEERPFKSIEDVMRVKGIKEATFEAIKDQITVR